MPTIVDITYLTPAQGFIVQGDTAGDEAGWSVSGAGDINGDGIDDFVVGARRGDDGGMDAGEAYVIFGKAGATRANLDLTNFSASDGFVIQGDNQYDGLGYSVSAAGDINGDGFADLIVGAPSASVPPVTYSSHNESGLSYVIYGKAGATRSHIDVTNLATADGFVIEGDRFGDLAGRNVSGAGDVNGDGVDDIVVGAQQGDNGGTSAGEVYVVFGKTGATRANVNLSTFPSTEGFIVQGDNQLDNLGNSVSSAGDVNGDGIDDFIIGAYFGDDTAANAGEAYVIFGKVGATRATIDLTTFAAADGFIIAGNRANVMAGTSVSSAGDINGDGIDDLLVGAAPIVGTSMPDEAYVIFGKAGATRSNINVASLAPTDGFIISGDAILGGTGGSVSDVGDVNGDGIDDIIVGSVRSNIAGTAYVIFGKTGSTRADINVADISDEDGYTIIGDAKFDFFGHSVSGAGDINGDGKVDLIIGARAGDDGGNFAGEAYVLFGGIPGGIVTTSGNDVLFNPIGDDRFNGGPGIDHLDMSSYTGVIILDVPAGTITRSNGVVADQDTFVNIEFFTLGSGPNLVTLGNSSVVVSGGNSDDVLTGGTSRDLLAGGGGNDTLSGGAGAANELGGGLGNDTYIVSAIGDTVIEAAGEGADEIQTALAIMVNRVNVETLRFTSNAAHTGIGNTHNETIIGNTGRDDLFGRDGNDVLRGGTGAANTLFGGAGDDIYFVDAIGDSVIENAGEGVDSVTTTLLTFTLKSEVENLTFTGNANATGIGNASGNSMTGAGGADFLSGLDGDDVLTGGLGTDFLIGGAGADTFRFSGGFGAGVDRVFDFVSGVDKIALLGTRFAHTATVDYVAGTVATSTNSTFLYNSANGVLSYDADGTGAGASVAIANLGGGAVLNVGDFLFY